jgi:hypothetical protein
MGAAPYFDEEELAALGRPTTPQAARTSEGDGPGKVQRVRLTHDPLCSQDGAVERYRCRECEVIMRTRIDDLRRQRALDRARSRAAHPAGKGLEGTQRSAAALAEQLPLWRDF